MSDNSFEEKESNKIFDIEEKDLEEKNTLVKVIKEIEKEEKDIKKKDSIPSSINKNEMNQNSKFSDSTIMNIENKLNEKIFMHLNKDKIPLIMIKDENKLVNGENIETYINSPFYPNLDDNTYNMCEKCRKSNNYFFCEKCSKNLYDNCSDDCYE